MGNVKKELKKLGHERPLKKVKLLGWLDEYGELRFFEPTGLNGRWKRVPGEDKEIEVEQ